MAVVRGLETNLLSLVQTELRARDNPRRLRYNPRRRHSSGFSSFNSSLCSIHNATMQHFIVASVLQDGIRDAQKQSVSSFYVFRAVILGSGRPEPPKLPVRCNRYESVYLSLALNLLCLPNQTCSRRGQEISTLALTLTQ